MKKRSKPRSAASFLNFPLLLKKAGSKAKAKLRPREKALVAQMPQF